MQHQQATSPPDVPPKAVNPASVPQLSPFRYPGGKTWLVPLIRRWLVSRPPPGLFLEPFAGGASIGLMVGVEGRAESVQLVELDAQIAAVWQCIFEGDAEALAQRIESFELSQESLQQTLTNPPQDRLDLAFQTLLKNRTFHGGVIAAGSAPLRHGEGGKGIHSRWYAQTLARRIRTLSTHRQRFGVAQEDGIQWLETLRDRVDLCCFIDPPYTAAGKRAGRRLYTHSSLDHERLFWLAAQLKGEVLLTYDDSPEVRALARRFGFEVATIPMRNTHHSHLQELLIGRSMAWTGQFQPTDLSA